MRSSVVPQTMASETAQKENWNSHFDSIVASERPITANAPAGRRSREEEPGTSPMSSPLPKASAKPTAQTGSAAIEKLARIFATTVPTFLPREKPISRNAKPACMNITSSAATTTQIELIATLCGSTPFSAASKVSAEATAGSSKRQRRPRRPAPR